MGTILSQSTETEPRTGTGTGTEPSRVIIWHDPLANCTTPDYADVNWDLSTSLAKVRPWFDSLTFQLRDTQGTLLDTQKPRYLDHDDYITLNPQGHHQVRFIIREFDTSITPIDLNLIDPLSYYHLKFNYSDPEIILIKQISRIDHGNGFHTPPQDTLESWVRQRDQNH